MSATLARHDRAITHLTLDPIPRQAIPRTIFLVEDALRTASLPGVERELYVIRHLHLGDIHPGQSSLSLSRRIELEWSRLRLTAVDYRSPSAPTANIIVFPSHAAVLAAFLTHRLTTNASPLPWFYPRLLPASLLTTTTPQLLPALLDHTFATLSANQPPTAPAEFLHEFAITTTPNLLPLALASTSDEAIHSFIQRWLPQSAALTLPRHRPTPSSTPAITPSSPRTLFTAAISMLLHSDRLFTAQALDTHLTTRPHLFLDTTQTQTNTPTLPTTTSLSNTTTNVAQPTTNSPTLSTTNTTALQPNIPPTNEATATTPQTSKPTLQPTRLAGLYFTLPILHHLNFFTTIPIEEQPPLLHSILVLTATATGIPIEDPLFPPPTELHPSAHDWFLQLRRWPRRHARLLLNWIVRRPAHVHLSRSHIDLYFSLNQADIRLRRLGLDINPGWHPALAKVITYHYDDYQR